MDELFRRSEIQIMKKRFYDSRVCPDCLRPRDFAKGGIEGLWLNIMCRHCGAWFRIYPQIRSIERG